MTSGGPQPFQSLNVVKTPQTDLGKTLELQWGQSETLMKLVNTPMVFETPQGLQDAFKTPKETISSQRSLFKDSLNFLQNFMIKPCRLNIFIYFVFLSVFCNTCIHWVHIHLCVRRCECVNPLSGVTAVRMCDIIAPSRIKVPAHRRHTDTDWSWDETGQTPVIVKKRKKKAYTTCSETDNQLLWLEKNSWIDRTTSRIFYLTLIFVGIFLRNCLSVSSASLLS